MAFYTNPPTLQWGNFCLVVEGPLSKGWISLLWPLQYPPHVIKLERRWPAGDGTCPRRILASPSRKDLGHLRVRCQYLTMGRRDPEIHIWLERKLVYEWHRQKQLQRFFLIQLAQLIECIFYNMYTVLSTSVIYAGCVSWLVAC